MNILQFSSQLLTFLALTGAGMVVIGWSLLFGGHDHDHEAHHDHSHDHDGDGGEPTVSFLSPKVVASFLVGFGAAGSVGTIYGFGPIASTSFGALGGIVVGAASFGVMKLIYSQQASSSLQPGAAVGKTGRVATSIPGDGMGEVSVSIGGIAQTFLARATDGGPIPSGNLVKVERDVGSTLFVTVTK